MKNLWSIMHHVVRISKHTICVLIAQILRLWPKWLHIPHFLVWCFSIFSVACWDGTRFFFGHPFLLRIYGALQRPLVRTFFGTIGIMISLDFSELAAANGDDFQESWKYVNKLNNFLICFSTSSAWMQGEPTSLNYPHEHRTSLSRNWT